MLSFFSKPFIIKIKSITNSTYLDVFGVILVISISMSLGYHNTKINFNWQNIEYYFPLGIFSILNTSFSMIGTRLVTKKNNIGNFIFIFNTFLSGLIDYLLGNIAAILTYPISIVGNYFAYKIWKTKHILNSIDFVFYRNITLGFVLSFVLNYIGFLYFSKENINWQLFFVIAIPAGLSFGGTFNTGRKYPDTWVMWQIYNVFKIVQNLLMLNFANVAKYFFYFFNAIIGYITWKDDKKITDKQ
jgi:hypothetical protein